MGLFNLRNRAHFTVEQDGEVIKIVDLNTGDWSVTNDAEGVVEELRRDGYNVVQHKIVYRDSLGNWDQLLTDARGRFKDFRPLGDRKLVCTEKDYQKARARALGAEEAHG